MSCRIEIILARYADAVSVPVQSVVRIDGKTYVWVRGSDGKPSRHEVEIGLDNNIEVHVIDGLVGGEEVLLTPPLSDSVRLKGSIENSDRENKKSPEGV